MPRLRALHAVAVVALSLCAAHSAQAIGYALLRREAVVDCQAYCQALGQATVDVGVPSKTLCAAVENGKLAYGTWMKKGTDGFNRAVCRIHSFSTGSSEKVNDYDCLCKAPATILSWKADLACAAGPTAAAQAPAVCRIKKPSGGDFQVGWFDAKPGGGTCYMGDVAKMWGIQTPIGFNSLDWAKNGTAYGMQPAGGAIKRCYSKPDCGFTCSQQNLATIASSDATPGKVVCINHLGPGSYGTTLNGNCTKFSDTKSFTVGENYMCACRGKADELSWKQSDLCAKVPLGAAIKPSICGIKKPGANDFRIGAWKNTTNSCLVAAVPWGPQGQQVFNVSGLGGSLQTTLLCRSRDPTSGMMYDSRPGFRWQGINESDYSCPPGPPRRANASSFVSWIYWTALGAGPDYLNGLNWKDGNLFTLKSHGKPVGQSAWVTFPLNKYILVAPASTKSARLGDLVFFGYGSTKHVGLYVGADQMVSFSGNLTGKDYGLPRLESVYARGDIDQIRTYTDSLALA
ncbi:hypothetical protein ABPG75_002051 [Micractinium tetrahymenae]